MAVGSRGRPRLPLLGLLLPSILLLLLLFELLLLALLLCPLLRLLNLVTVLLPRRSGCLLLFLLGSSCCRSGGRLPLALGPGSGRLNPRYPVLLLLLLLLPPLAALLARLAFLLGSGPRGRARLCMVPDRARGNISYNPNTLLGMDCGRVKRQNSFMLMQAEERQRQRSRNSSPGLCTVTEAPV